MPIRPMNYTGVRANRYETALIDYETAKVFFTPRSADMREARAEYYAIVEKLNKQQKKADIDAARREAIAEKKAQEAAKKLEESLKRIKEREKAAKAKRKAERQAAAEQKKIDNQIRSTLRAVRGSVLYSNVFGKGDDIPFGDMIEVAEQMRKRNTSLARFIVAVDGVNTIDTNVSVDTSKSAETIYWNSIFPTLRNQGSDEGASITNAYSNGVELPDNARIRLTILSNVDLPAERLQQAFRDGAVHCVIQPLVNLWATMANNSESDASRKRCRQIAATISALENKYPLGVPQGEDMELVARAAKRKVIICNILNQELEVYNKSCNKLFVFTNTRKNHIEPGKLAINCNYEYVSQEQLNATLADHIANKVFFMVDGDIKNGVPSRIRSLKGAWCVLNPDKEIFDAFNEKIGIKNCQINAVQYPELNAFLKESRIINAWVAPLSTDPNDATGHIDLKAAYTQAKHCAFYEGYLGTVHQYRNVEGVDASFMDKHTGIYRFRVVSMPSALLSMLGMKYNECYTLPSPEIKYYISLGLCVQLIEGAWGSTIHIDWTEEMLENRRYCLWAGKLGQDKPEESYTFYGDKKWASHLKATLGDAQVYFSDYTCGEQDYSAISVRVPKKSYYTCHQVLSFITSYVRIMMIQTMMQFDLSQLRKVVLDGLYFVGENKATSELFGVKEVKDHQGFRNGWFQPSDLAFDFPKINNDLLCNSVLTGQGGSGKSYSVLNDSGFVNVMYVVPQHKLGQKMNQAHGVRYETIHKMIGLESKDKNDKVVRCRAFREEKRIPNVIFVDELTMCEAAWIDKLIEMYPECLIFIAGDIDNKMWFQCRNGKPGMYSTVWMNRGYNMVEYKNDYRSQCDDLKQFKLRIRDAMRMMFVDGGVVDAKKLNGWIMHNYKVISEDEAVGMFQKGDTWIAGTHKTSERLLAAGVVSGCINERTKEMSAELIEDWTVRGSFTTHSYQGLTIKDGRVFVSINDAFELAMVYTAVSRAVRMDQIVLVA
jgi:hypothetical protein